VPLDQYLHPRLSYLTGPALIQFKREMAQALGRFLASLHELRIFHADLKPSNIMVRERTAHDWEFILVDLDRVRFDREVDPKRRARNLAQLDSAFQHRLTYTDRLRCFRAYLEAAPDVGEARPFLRLVQAQSERLLRYNWQALQRMLDELKPEDVGIPKAPQSSP
jgi:tRNA A-37 threonylcarbamoyl transferase component Bud32